MKSHATFVSLQAHNFSSFFLILLLSLQFTVSCLVYTDELKFALCLSWCMVLIRRPGWSFSPLIAFLSSSMFNCFLASFAKIQCLRSTVFPRNHWAPSDLRSLQSYNQRTVTKGTMQECPENKGGRAWFLLSLTLMTLNFLLNKRKTLGLIHLFVRLCWC